MSETSKQFARMLDAKAAGQKIDEDAFTLVRDARIQELNGEAASWRLKLRAEERQSSELRRRLADAQRREQEALALARQFKELALKEGATR